MIGGERQRLLSGGFAVGAFDDLFLRGAVLYERASRAFRTIPEMRGFLLQQAAALRQTALTPVSDVDAVWRMCEAIIVATEHYLDEVEQQRRPPTNVVALPHIDDGPA